MSGGTPRAVTLLQNIARAAIAVGAGASILNTSLYTVDGGHRAVLFDRFRGVLDETSSEGPFLDSYLAKALHLRCSDEAQKHHHRHGH